MIQAEIEFRGPAPLEPPSPALSPGGDLYPLVVGGVYYLRYLQERLVGGDKDGAEEHILDQERV